MRARNLELLLADYAVFNSFYGGYVEISQLWHHVSFFLNTGDGYFQEQWQYHTAYHGQCAYQSRLRNGSRYKSVRPIYGIAILISSRILLRLWWCTCKSKNLIFTQTCHGFFILAAFVKLLSRLQLRSLTKHAQFSTSKRMWWLMTSLMTASCQKGQQIFNSSLSSGRWQRIVPFHGVQPHILWRRRRPTPTLLWLATVYSWQIIILRSA